MGRISDARRGDYSHLWSPPMMEYEPLTYAKKAGGKKKKKDDDGPNCKNSQECNVGGKRYCIPKGKTCGGKVRAPLDPRRVDDLRKMGGTFEGAIGGLKNGKKYQVSPEMLAVANKLGVSQLQLQSGRVPKAVQADLIKSFDQMTIGDSVTKTKPAGALAVRPGLMTQTKAEQEDRQTGGGKKTDQQRMKQFERIAQRLMNEMEKQTDSLRSASQDKLVTADGLRKKAQQDMETYTKSLEAWNKMTPKQYIKLEEDKLKKARANIRTEQDPDMKDLLKQLLASDKKRLDKMKADPENALKSRIKATEDKLITAMEDASKNFEAEATKRNKEVLEARSAAEDAIKKARSRMQRAWDAMKTQDSPDVRNALASLGVKSTGVFADDIKNAKNAFRKRAQETHPDLGGDPNAFREVSRSWEVIRSAQMAGGGPPLVNPFLMGFIKEAGFNLQ